MTNESQLLQKIARLEREQEALRQENEILTDKAEDFLLLGIIAEKIGLAKSKEEVIDLTLESVSSLKDIYYSAFIRRNNSTVELTTDYAPFSSSHNKEKSFQLTDEILEALHMNDFVFACEEASQVPSFVPDMVHDQSPKSYSLIPVELPGGNGCSYIFLFVSYIQGRDYMQAILPLLCRVIEIACVKIEAISFSHDIQSLNKSLESKVQERTAMLSAEIVERKEAQKMLQQKLSLNKALADLSKVVISTCSFSIVTDHVLKVAKDLTASKHGYVGVIDPKTKNLIVLTLNEMMISGDCQIEGREKEISFPIGEDGSYHKLWGYALNTMNPFLTNSPLSHPSAKGVPEDHIPIERFLTAPVMFNNELIGQISLANAEHDYTKDDMQYVEHLAGIYAMAINRHRTQEEHDKLMSELRQSQKMEAIGTLAGGIAHDFNNILTALLGYLELAKLKAKQGGDVSNYLDHIYIAFDRAKNLVKQILTFSRQSEHELKPVQVHLIAKEAIKLLRASIPATIEIQQDISSDCGYVNADPTQIHQVFMNLCTNAYHAMLDSGGTLGITISEKSLTPEDHIANIALPPGRYLKIEINDTGYGMDEDTRKRIFEPYFTTKKKGGGTGLGLAVVHGIVKNHHGHITAYSEKDVGSSFHIYLPLISSGVKYSPTDCQEETVGGHERILFVDDEEPIAQLGILILENLGYQITSFTDSKKALLEFKENPQGYDLVITDMTMPNMTGVELALTVKEIRPNIPIILCTGFSEIINSNKAEALGIDAYVTKPVTTLEISKIIRKVLNKNPSVR